MIIKELYKFALREFSNAKIEDFHSEVDCIFKKYFNLSKIDIILNGNKYVPKRYEEVLLQVLNKRKSGVPLQYIMGEWEFMGLKLKVGFGVLIPRDDTTVLVNEALKCLSRISNPIIIDLCSGTGCIALAMEKYLDNCSEIYAVEKSKEAFNYIIENIKLNKSKSKFINDDIFKVYKKFEDEYFDAIISNPPYIKSNEISSLQKEVRKEPLMALDGGNDGLFFYEKIIDLWSPKLKIGGIIAFEVGKNQSEQVIKMLKEHNFKNLHSVKDINNIERVVIGVK